MEKFQRRCTFLVVGGGDGGGGGRILIFILTLTNWPKTSVLLLSFAITRSDQDGICACKKAVLCSCLSLRSLPSVALEMAPMLV